MRKAYTFTWQYREHNAYEYKCICAWLCDLYEPFCDYLYSRLYYVMVFSQQSGANETANGSKKSIEVAIGYLLINNWVIEIICASLRINFRSSWHHAGTIHKNFGTDSLILYRGIPGGNVPFWQCNFESFISGIGAVQRLTELSKERKKTLLVNW